MFHEGKDIANEKYSQLIISAQKEIFLNFHCYYTDGVLHCIALLLSDIHYLCKKKLK